MPELPEVETVRRTLERALLGHEIVEAEFPADTIVQKGLPDGAARAAVLGARVTGVGRKGKYFWLELDRKPWLFAHLGMAGWLRELGEPTIRLREHGNAPMEDEEGRPRFLKMLLTGANGRRIAMTDGRRLARIWLGDDPKKALPRLGPDMLNEPWEADKLQAKLKGRSAPIKAMLLDQTLFCGIGNWIADEVLYRAGILPSREAGSLSLTELEALIRAIKKVIEFATEVGADSKKYPADWLFHHRWGGKKGSDSIDGEQILREQVGGRTTAWVPTRQK